ncbi:hypothetical protein Goklo_000695, partial [Gossypium klotzschianum]|nr:hypothetical protein [Gossypium klotzschianum]
GSSKFGLYNYYLTKFESVDDYTNVISKGPWVEIGEMVGTVIKVDLQTNKGARGQFERFVVHVDLLKPPRTVKKNNDGGKVNVNQGKSLNGSRFNVIGNLREE